ncbi:MAG: cytochrome c [Gammaproteobacteria bacterium]|nr:cytochrome c [Gammaproteobacteria bacterium]
MGRVFAVGEEVKGHGEYVFRIAGCTGCHTDHENHGPFLAGGRALRTDFGTFYTPNITPHPEDGIGRWTETDFIRAMAMGIALDGNHYFPSFPFPSYTLMSGDDLHALWTYLKTVPPVAKVSRPHQLPWYLSSGISTWLWNALYFQPGPFREEADRSVEWNRGAYLALALGHCSECHTPRDFLGAPTQHLPYAGDHKVQGVGVVPNITPDIPTGIGSWSHDDLSYFLESGALPDGDFTGGKMAEVIDNGLQYLTVSDRKALSTYLLSLRSIKNRVGE